MSEGWDQVEAAELSSSVGMDEAKNAERERCSVVVQSEIEEGRIRGIPETSGTMIILHRIAAAIAHGG